MADIIKCRVLWLDRRKHIVHSIGTAGDCSHDPPRALLEPNGDTPLADGGVLVTEIGGWIDRFSATGQLMWSIKAPTDYPSDAQLLPNGNVLVAGFNTPGRIDILAQRANPLDLRTIDWSRSARSPLARGAAPQRQHRRHRRLASLRCSHRPGQQADRLAVRARRHPRNRPRLPRQRRTGSTCCPKSAALGAGNVIRS